MELYEESGMLEKEDMVLQHVANKSVDLKLKLSLIMQPVLPNL